MLSARSNKRLPQCFRIISCETFDFFVRSSWLLTRVTRHRLLARHGVTSIELAHESGSCFCQCRDAWSRHALSCSTIDAFLFKVSTALPGVTIPHAAARHSNAYVPFPV